MEYLSKDTVLRIINHQKTIPLFDREFLQEHIKLEASADVVEVVRCKDCGYMTYFKGRVMCSRNAKRINDETWCGLAFTDNEYYCSYGERIADNG